MRIFGFEIKKIEKKPYKPYNDNCMYCPRCEPRGKDFWLSKNKEVEIGYCTKIGMLVDELTTPPCYLRH